MTGGNKLVFSVVFLMVFVLILSVGLSSDVSISASLIRAVSGAAFFTLLLWGALKIIYHSIISGINSDAEAGSSNATAGQRLNITVSDPISEEEVSPAAVQKPSGSFQDFSPLATQQINPEIEKIINNDPKRMAEIIKKMGFEE